MGGTVGTVSRRPQHQSLRLSGTRPLPARFLLPTCNFPYGLLSPSRRVLRRVARGTARWRAGQFPVNPTFGEELIPHRKEAAVINATSYFAPYCFANPVPALYTVNEPFL